MATWIRKSAHTRELEMVKRPENLQIVVRQPDIDLRPLMRRQRYWLGGDPVLTHFINALQATFPEGERFFIDSARDVSATLPPERMTPALQQDLNAFIQQEARHGRAHDAWCDALVDIGYTRMPEYDAQMKKLRLWSRKHIGALTRLALTAAAEHMTASIALLLLERRSDLLENAERPVRDLLAWHALEECEHKAVCFDLYQAAGGGYLRRSIALLFELFDIYVHVQTRLRYLLKTDGLWTWKMRWRVFRDIWGPRGVMGSMYGLLWRYLRPGFHPWDSDERAAFTARYGDLIPR
ncbi:metal-dependent hydrolase [Sinimarinibacterium sp. CAU 1509]|uniref:metal-dependent hydrolase n=1 Tax=Sinimarinibacterium sp. CAU 1509 TaxID=2562283 RepID=UPI00146A8D03|nr:metal-dependent hydrolase [Sinimarinibacterium sp. CAU 1509]